MYKPIKKLIYISLFTVISCSNMNNFCKHGTSFHKSQFAYNALALYEGVSTEYFLATEKIVTHNAEVQPITWENLKNVTFKVRFNKQYQMDFQYPVFGKEIKKLEGTEVSIAGYIIPLDVNQGLYAISRYPYSSCYFCGKSGPESVVSLKFKDKPKKYKLDKFKTMKGTLKLNDSNPMDFIFIFNNTEEMKTGSD